MKNLEPFDSRSQAAQDRFAFELIGEGGTYLDIGASHPSERSNTFALEKQGWTGILVENDEHCVGLLKAMRSKRLIAEDATGVDWKVELKNHPRIDYLSLDVDEASLTVLRNVLDSGVRFRVLTIEHDEYRFGTERRLEMVRLLTEHGYTVLCDQVSDQGLSFEIWAVERGMKVSARFVRSGPTNWKEFFA